MSGQYLLTFFVNTEVTQFFRRVEKRLKCKGKFLEVFSFLVGF